MNIKFKYYTNTSNLEFSNPDRMNIIYTMVSELIDTDNEFIRLIFGQHGAPKRKMGTYKRVNANSHILGTQCSICLDNFECNQGYRTLKCDHHFHKKCIDKWLTRGSSDCPLCRQEV